MSIKSSGTNYLLFFTRINNTNYCFYIDRKISPGYTVPRIISSKYGFSDDVFTDTYQSIETAADGKDDSIVTMAIGCGDTRKLHKDVNDDVTSTTFSGMEEHIEEKFCKQSIHMKQMTLRMKEYRTMMTYSMSLLHFY